MSEHKFLVRIWSKSDTQAFIKSLREAGYTVEKESTRYVSWHREGLPGGDALVFAAMPDRRGYICRINSAYVTIQGDVTQREIKDREQATPRDKDA